jgi:hypothetical protein
VPSAPPSQDTIPFGVQPDGHGGGYVGIDRIDAAPQQFTRTHVRMAPDGAGRFRSIPFATCGGPSLA